MSTIPADLPFSLGGDSTLKTLTQLLAIVRARGDARNTTRFTDAYLTAELQAAFNEGYELIVEQNEGFFDQYDNVTTTAHVAFVAGPQGPPPFWIIRAVDRVDGGDFVPLPRIGIKDRNRYGSTEGRPGAHRLSARGIELYPTPDAVYTLRVLHTPCAPLLGGDALNYYNGWEEYSVYGALVRLFDTQDRDSSKWQKQLDRTAARIIKAAGERNSSGPEYLNLREGLGAEFSDDNPDEWRRGF